MGALHLAKRFFGSLRPGGPPRSEVGWVHGQLLPGERKLWDAMPGPDRRHSAAVARRVDAAWADAPRDVLAAALLHDVGKVEAGVRTFGRVVATVTARVVGRERAEAWDSSIGRYLRHPEAGARALGAAGSAPLTVAWAREHHRPEAQWTVDAEVGRVLKDADDD